MHRSVHLFNPSHDMALATFSSYYKSPADIVGMADDLSALPVWIASEGDAVYTRRAEECKVWFAREEYARLLPQVEWTDGVPRLEVRPWGWNPALVAELRRQGADEAFLPSDERLERIRLHSGRNCYAGLLAELTRIPGTCGRSEVCVSLAQALRFMEDVGQTVLKAPWSGSGRGLMRLSPDGLTPSAEGWIKRVLRTQGCIMAEPQYEREEDFAMEFYADACGEVSFAGYSLFETDAHGNYKGNYLLSEAEIEKRLASYVTGDVLEAVKEHLLVFFRKSLRGVHAGYFGVDMMICRERGRYLLHPLVEVNLRMTMGVVSLLFFSRYCSESATGTYRVEFFRTDGAALEFDERMRRDFPLQLSDGKISSGYLSLTPVSSAVRYLAYVQL